VRTMCHTGFELRLAWIHAGFRFVCFLASSRVCESTSFPPLWVARLWGIFATGRMPRFCASAYQNIKGVVFRFLAMLLLRTDKHSPRTKVKYPLFPATSRSLCIASLSSSCRPENLLALSLYQFVRCLAVMMQSFKMYPDTVWFSGGLSAFPTRFLCGLGRLCGSRCRRLIITNPVRIVPQMLTRLALPLSSLDSIRVDKVSVLPDACDLAFACLKRILSWTLRCQHGPARIQTILLGLSPF
jgi:hypothetical protein